MHIVNLLNRLFYCRAQVIKVYRLCGKVKSAIIHRLADVAHVTVGTDHDTTNGGIAQLVDFSQQRKTIHFWHVDIRKDNFNVWILIEQGYSFQAVVRKEKFIFSLTNLPSKILCQQQLEIHLVVDTQYFYRHKLLCLIINDHPQ